MQERRDDRSVADLLSDLTRQITTLVRQEVDLARTEISASAGRVGKNIAFLAAGGAVLYAGFLGLMAAVVFLLVNAGMDAWLAALIVGGIVAAVGVALVMKGRSALQAEDLTPRRTLQTLKEDVEMVGEQTSR